MVRINIFAIFAIAVPALAALKPDVSGAKNVGNGKGLQFIGGQCLNAADCASGCCAGVTGQAFALCSGPGAQNEQGKLGCGFGNTYFGTDAAQSTSVAQPLPTPFPNARVVPQQAQATGQAAAPVRGQAPAQALALNTTADAVALNTTNAAAVNTTDAVAGCDSGAPLRRARRFSA